MTRAGHAAQKTPMRRTPHGRHVFSAQGAHSSFNSFRHLGQIFFPLNTVMSLVASQKTQLGLYFFQNDGRAYHIDFQCILLADIQRPAHLDREHDPSQFIHLSDNSR